MPQYWRNKGKGGDKIRLDLVNPPSTVYLAEGDSEGAFLEAMLHSLGRNPDHYAVFVFAGKSKLIRALRALTNDAAFTRVRGLGIMVDADASAAATLGDVLETLEQFPDFPNARVVLATGSGTIGPRAIEIFVSPGGGLAGDIESLVLVELAGKARNGCVDQFDLCQQAHTKHPLTSKARVSAYLSTLLPTGTVAHKGFESGDLNVQDPAYSAARLSLSKL